MVIVCYCFIYYFGMWFVKFVEIDFVVFNGNIWMIEFDLILKF